MGKTKKKNEKQKFLLKTTFQKQKTEDTWNSPDVYSRPFFKCHDFLNILIFFLNIYI